jgi:hypothetical protein
LVFSKYVRADAFVGEVTGTSSQVHVRSGPSTNFYPVVRLAPGDRVQVVGEDSGWYAIEPLPGCYSLISKHYVDIGAGEEGVVNGDAVRVRVGSDLDEHRYAVQLKLDKGAAVRVLGEEAEGFLKIAPPNGARLWIHGDYVARVPDDRLAHERSAALAGPQTLAAGPATSTADDTAEGDDAVVENIASPGSGAGTGAAGDTGTGASRDATGRGDEPALSRESLTKIAAGAAPSAEDDQDDDEVATLDGEAAPRRAADARSARTDVPPDVRQRSAVARLPVDESGADEGLRQRLNELDSRLERELAKPIEDRQLPELSAGYTELAAQEADRYVQLYAERRLAQVELAMTTFDAIRDIRSLSDDVARQRRESLEERSGFRSPAARLVFRGFDAKGELRESMIFGSPVGPKRYRLVDPDVTVPRTLCYVEVAESKKIDMTDYLGRLVGIRATKQYLETGNVDPIPVVVAEEIVILDRPTDSGDDARAEVEAEDNQPDSVALIQVDTHD